MGHVTIEPVPAVLKREYPDAPPFLGLLRGKSGKTRWVPCDEIAMPLQSYRLAFGMPPVLAPLMHRCCSQCGARNGANGRACATARPYGLDTNLAMKRSRTLAHTAALSTLSALKLHRRIGCDTRTLRDSLQPSEKDWMPAMHLKLWATPTGAHSARTSKTSRFARPS